MKYNKHQEKALNIFLKLNEFKGVAVKIMHHTIQKRVLTDHIPL